MKSYPETSVFRKAVEKYGTEKQILQTVEECNELSVSLLHALRPEKQDIEAVLGELADVQIMLHQMIYVFDIDEYEKIYEKKIISLENRLKNKIHENVV